MAVTARALQGTGGNNAWRDKSSGVSWKYSVTAPTWRSAAECSTVGKRWSGKLHHRWLKDGCVGRQATMTKQTGGIRQRGSGAVCCRHLYCTLGRPTWTRIVRLLQLVQLYEKRRQSSGLLYTGWPKTGTLCFVRLNFIKYLPIFKLISLSEWENVCNNTVTNDPTRPPHLKLVTTLPCEMSVS